MRVYTAPCVSQRRPARAANFTQRHSSVSLRSSCPSWSSSLALRAVRASEHALVHKPHAREAHFSRMNCAAQGHRSALAWFESKALRVAPCPPCSAASSRKPPPARTSAQRHAVYCRRANAHAYIFPPNHAVAASAADVSHRVQAGRHEALLARPGPHVGHGTEEVRLPIATVERLQNTAWSKARLARCAWSPDSCKATRARRKHAAPRGACWSGNAPNPGRATATHSGHKLVHLGEVRAAATAAVRASLKHLRKVAAHAHALRRGAPALSASTRLFGAGAAAAGGVRAKLIAQGRRSGRETRSVPLCAGLGGADAACTIAALLVERRTNERRYRSCTGCIIRQLALLRACCSARQRIGFWWRTLAVACVTA